MKPEVVEQKEFHLVNGPEVVPYGASLLPPTSPRPDGAAVCVASRRLFCYDMKRSTDSCQPGGPPVTVPPVGGCLP